MSSLILLSSRRLPYHPHHGGLLLSIQQHYQHLLKNNNKVFLSGNNGMNFNKINRYYSTTTTTNGNETIINNNGTTPTTTLTRASSIISSTNNTTDSMDDLLHRTARQAPTPVSLHNLYHFGKIAAKDPKQRLRNAQFLHNELQIRIAGRVVELEKLPLDMCQTKGVKEVVSSFVKFFEMINRTPYPIDEAGEEEFTKVLKKVLLDHNQIVETMARGALEVKSRPDFDHASQKAVDSVLSRFYMARIGLRFLIEHHIQSRTAREGFAGIIQSACCPIECVEQAANDAAMICTHHLGESPDVQILQVKRDGTRLSGASNKHSNNITFTYVPGHMLYILTEVLKNACRATVEEHAKRGNKLPPIRIVIVEGANDVTIRISDEGGGIRRKDMDVVWSYLHTTAKSPPEIGQGGNGDTGGGGGGVGGGSNVPALAGYGVGLPLSRLYARYFGGELAIKSLEGFGTGKK
jgi:pyruvate dehydrogenase kinase 2/3/4